jgi:hypothetical protein
MLLDFRVSQNTSLDLYTYTPQHLLELSLGQVLPSWWHDEECK